MPDDIMLATSPAAAVGRKYFDTIVIGAGTSGLACASRLFQQDSNRTLKVLEARDRIGGRIGAVHINGCRLDTGANWIHGTGTDENPNPLMKVLPHKRYRELSGSVVFRPPSLQDDEDGKQQQGSRVIPHEAAETLMGSMWGMVGELHELAAETELEEAKITTVVEAVVQTEAFADAFEELDPEFHQALRGLPQFVENMEAAPLVAESAEHEEERPGVSLLEYAIDDFEGDQVFLQDGYLAVINELAKELVDAEAIETGVEVEQIHWEGVGVVVETNVGTYEAKTVICTLPLGVLKARVLDPPATSQPNASKGPKSRQSSFFQPQLPQEKIEAISSLGFGTLDKIFLVYAHPWWTEEAYTSIWKDGIVRRHPSSSSPPPTENDEPDSFMGFTDSLPGLEVHEDGSVSEGLRILSLINLHALAGFPALSAFVSCANARIIESMSDEDASALVHGALQSWIGRDLPDPDAVYVTRWAADPYSGGSYSSMVAGVSETKHRTTIGKPMRNEHGAEVRFAGEHTSENHFATVHGALLSGWREADAILEGSKTS